MFACGRCAQCEFGMWEFCLRPRGVPDGWYRCGCGRMAHESEPCTCLQKLLPTLVFVGLLTYEARHVCPHGKWAPAFHPDEWCFYCDSGMST